MTARTTFATLLVTTFIASGCTGGGAGGSSDKASSGDNNGQTTPSPTPTPLPPAPPVIPPVPTIAINQGVVATSESQIAIDFDKPGMLEMKISFDKDCSGGTWEDFSDTRTIKLADSQLNQRIDVSVVFKDPELFNSVCYTTSILHDNIPPVIQIDRAVPVVTNNPQQQIAFHADDSGAGVQQLYCVIPGQLAAAPCSGLYDGNLADGGYAVQLLASDNAGNLSSPTTVSFTVDTTAPTVALNSVPPAITAGTSARFEFSGSDNLTGVDHFECKVDQQAAYTTCANGQTYGSLTQGSHSVEVRSVDGAGNSSPVASYTWTVDSQAPSVRFTQTPAPIVNQGGANFAFTGQESDGTTITKFECRLDGGAFANCSSPRALSGLAEGSHTFGVRGTSRAGVVSSELTYTWAIDMTAPSVTISKGPSSLTNSTSANFTYSAADNSSGVKTVTCRLDGAAAKDCSSMVQAYTGLAGDRTHTFDVVVTDQAGNVGYSAPYIWYIDSTLPTVQIVAVPPTVTSQTSSTFQVMGNDDYSAVSFQCKLDGAAVFTVCNTTINYANVADGTHTFSVVSRDAAGNLSPVSNYTWVVDTVGPVIKFTQTPNDTITTIDLSSLTYTITDSISQIISATCQLDSSPMACPIPNGTLNFPKLPVGNHTFTLVATNAAGISSTRSYSFAVQPYCSTTIGTTTLPTKILFITDMSGSNQSAPGCALGPNCTDEGKKMRAGSIQQFFTDYKARTNFSWGFDIFQGTSSTALINSGVPTSPIFSNAPAMQTAINTFKNMSDTGATPYMASLKLATTLVANDPELKASTKPQYIVVFMSDGMPNGTDDNATNIINQVKAIMALSPGRISFNTIYYGPVNKTATDLMQSMATSGNGNFLNTNANPTGLTFSISDLINVPVTTCQ